EIDKNDAKGFLNSTNEFFNEQNESDSIQTINQYKTNYTNSSVFNTNMTYTEPLSKALSMILNYGLGINNSSSDRKSFNQSVSGEYDILDKEFSNDFELDQLSNQGGATFNLKMSKSTINIGTKISNVRFQQFDAYTDKTFKRNFLNWNPQASFQYRFSQQKSMRLSYYGNTTQPGIDQIQPVRVNTDPLNITLGNPDLRPSFRSNLSVGYNSYKILSDQYIYMNGGYSFTANPIISLTTTDQAGKNTYQSINLRGKNPSNFYFSSAFSRKIKGLDVGVGIDLDANGNVDYTMVSDGNKTELNTTKSANYSGGLNLSKYKDDKYSFRISGGPSYNNISSSLQNRTNNKGWGFRGDGHFTVYLPGKVEISADGNYQYTAKTQTFDQDLERLILNSSVSKKFFKQENLMLSISGRDLLNQNVGFSRYASGNMVTQNSYTTIQRYFMCTLSWDFSKMGGSVPNK
ncbi:MAG: TonB-dependent receptor, partial [Pedobacter sp.]